MAGSVMRDQRESQRNQRGPCCGEGQEAVASATGTQEGRRIEIRIFSLNLPLQGAQGDPRAEAYMEVSCSERGERNDADGPVLAACQASAECSCSLTGFPISKRKSGEKSALFGQTTVSISRLTANSLK